METVPQQWKRRQSTKSFISKTKVADHEYVLLSDAEQQRAQDESLRTFVLIFIETVDMFLDLANYITFAIDLKEVEIFALLYTLNTIIITFLSVFVIKSHVGSFLLIRRELRNGIEVTKGRSRAMRNALGSGTVDQMEREKLALVEFEVVSLQRQQNRARFIVVSALLEDLISLVFVGYRLAYTDLLFSSALANCILSGKQMPALCLPWSSLIGLLQASSTIIFLAHKISYVRDFYTLESILHEKREALSKSGIQDGSVLDTFIPGEVSEHEINSVVEIRRMINVESENVLDFLPGSTDMRILGMLRKHRSDLVETAKSIQEWRSWRNRLRLNEIRRKVILDDLKQNDIPFATQWMSTMLFADAGYVDFEKGAMLYYAYTGARCNLVKLFSTLNEEEMRECIFYFLERTLFAWEQLSVKSRKVLTIRILCDATGLPEVPAGGFAESLQILSRVFNSVARYPFKVDVVMWQPDAELIHLIEDCRVLSSSQFQRVPSVAILESIVSVKFIPTSIGGRHELSGVEIPDDPWQLSQFKCKRISEVIGTQTCEISFFSDVEQSETKGLFELQANFRNLESDFQSLASNGEASVDAEIQRIGLELKRLELSKFSKGKLKAALKLKNRILAYKLLFANVWIHSQPVEVVGNVNLIRILRTVKFRMHDATNKLLKIIKYRERNKINDINKEIKDSDLSLSQLKGYSKISAAWPSDYVHLVDGNSGNILCVWAIHDMIDHQLTAKLTKEDFKEWYILIHEFLSILTDQLSRKFERTMTLLAFARAHALFKRDPLYSEHLKVMAFIRNELYVGLYQQEDIALCPTQKSLLARIHEGMYRVFDAVGDDKTIYVPLSNSERISQFIDRTYLSQYFGGQRSMHLNMQTIKYKKHIKLSSLIQSMTGTDVKLSKEAAEKLIREKEQELENEMRSFQENADNGPNRVSMALVLENDIN